MTSVLRWGSRKGKPQENSTEKKWLHSTDALQQGSVVYAVKLLGSTDVPQAKGTEIVREAIKKVRFANHIKKSEAGVKASKLRKVDIKISIDNIEIEDAKSKDQIYSYPLHRISYCADDKRDKKLFAFIAKDTGMPQHSCYVFECEKMAEELTLTVGQAFDLAYRRFLQKKATHPESQKKLTEMEEKIKAAEGEKEALRLKIAQLELAAGQGAAPSSGSSEPSQTQPDQNEFDLLGGFGGFAVMPNSPPQDSPSQEITFDPFAKISAEPPSPDQQQTEATVPPTSPDFNEFSPQPMIAPVPRPTPKGVVPQALPPPPTKQSVKAANRKKLSSGSLPLVQSPTSVTSPPSLPSPSNDLLQLGGSPSYSNGNPFAMDINNSTDPFAEHVFDPFSSKKEFLENGKEINQNTIKAGI